MKESFVSSFSLYPHEFFLKDLPYPLFEGNGLVLLDLVDVFASIFFQDIMIKKGVATRKIQLTIPVANPKLWIEATPIITKLVSFVSKDRLDIKFLPEDKPRSLPTERLIDVSHPSLETVTLLSGGLDSFCGAHTNIANRINSAYSGYTNNKFEQPRQQHIGNFVSQKSGNMPLWLFKKLDIKKKEYTQSTRSLLYLSLACALASSYQLKKVNIYENGVLSLNPSFNGRFTTKTTHPKTLYLFNTLLRILQLDLKIENPFMFLTKGHIINELSSEFKEQIQHTHTCGRGRQDPNAGKEQCGYCIPCILRKISISAYNLEEYDVKYKIGYRRKIHEITNNEIRSELKSSLGYFKKFKHYIDSREIYSFLHLRDNYYEDVDYTIKTDSMLKIFSEEVERFCKKYEID